MIERLKLTLQLRKRKAIRIVQQTEATRLYWERQRKRWKRDPLRQAN